MVSITWVILLLAPGATSMDQYGKGHDPSRPGSGYTVLDFAASWCKPCWKALPHVDELARTRDDIGVLVISVDRKLAGRDRLVKKLNLQVPVIWDQGHLWADFYQPAGMPTTMIVDTQGKVVYQHVGWSSEDWQKLLNELNRLTGRK